MNWAWGYSEGWLVLDKKMEYVGAFSWTHNSELLVLNFRFLWCSGQFLGVGEHRNLCVLNYFWNHVGKDLKDHPEHICNHFLSIWRDFIYFILSWLQRWHPMLWLLRDLIETWFDKLTPRSVWPSHGPGGKEKTAVVPHLFPSNCAKILSEMCCVKKHMYF